MSNQPTFRKANRNYTCGMCRHIRQDYHLCSATELGWTMFSVLYSACPSHVLQLLRLLWRRHCKKYIGWVKVVSYDSPSCELQKVCIIVSLFYSLLNTLYNKCLEMIQMRYNLSLLCDTKIIGYVVWWYKSWSGIICIGYVSSLYQCISLYYQVIIFLFSFFDTKIQTKWARYNKACFGV